MFFDELVQADNLLRSRILRDRMGTDLNTEEYEERELASDRNESMKTIDRYNTYQDVQQAFSHRIKKRKKK